LGQPATTQILFSVQSSYKYDLNILKFLIV
jgi:hypothetical protein